MHHDFVKVEGRKHPLVRNFVEFYEGLEAIVGDENLRLGEYQEVREGPSDPEYELRGKDDRTGNLKIIGRDSNYKQDFYVNLTPTNAADLKEYLLKHDAV